MNAEIYDLGDGIRIEFSEGDHGTYVDMTDEAAEELVRIIGNKLNGRFDK